MPSDRGTGAGTEQAGSCPQGHGSVGGTVLRHRRSQRASWNRRRQAAGGGRRAMGAMGAMGTADGSGSKIAEPLK